MSMSMPMSHEPRLTLITTSKVPPLAQAKNWFSKMWSRVSKWPGRFWNWAKKTLHLQPVVDGAKSFYQWLWTATKATASHFGWAGAGGSSMLLISTGGGRKVFSTLVGKPMRWLASMFSSAWTWVENKMVDNLGTPGTWIANRMVDIEEFFFGQPKGKKIGIFGHIKSFYNEHIASHMVLNNTFMRVVRLLGTAIMGALTVDGIVLLPLGGFLVATQWIVGVSVMASACWQGFYLGKHVATIEAVRGFFSSNSNHAAKKPKVNLVGAPSTK